MLLTVSVGSVDSEEIVNHHNNNIINARRMRARVTVLSLCVCVSPVYKALRRAVLQFEHNCRLYAIIAR